MEKRTNDRVEIIAYARDAKPEESKEHVVENVSLGGICLRSNLAWKLGQSIEVALGFPELGKQLAVQGTVVWVSDEKPADVGVKFEELKERDRAVLKQYISEYRLYRGLWDNLKST